MTSTGRWRFLVLPFVALCIALPNILRDRGFMVEAWPQWRATILALLLVLAGAALVAAVAAGFVAWRRGQRHA